MTGHPMSYCEVKKMKLVPLRSPYPWLPLGTGLRDSCSLNTVTKACEHYHIGLTIHVYHMYSLTAIPEHMYPRKFVLVKVHFVRRTGFVINLLK